MDGRPGLLCNGENLPLFIQWVGDCHKVLFGQGVIKASEELGMKKNAATLQKFLHWPVTSARLPVIINPNYPVVYLKQNAVL